MDLGVGRRLSYLSARRLLVLTGLVVLGATAAVLYVRRLETVEVVAVLLFVPIYLAVVLGKIRGGVVAAVLASVTYGVLRLRGVDTYSNHQEISLVSSRTLAYLAFGVVGGYAVRQLEAALLKLDRYDLVDDDTGLFNARFAANELQLEQARSTRYGSTFAVVALSGSVEPLRRLRRGRRAEVLRRLGETVSDAVRLVDRAAIGQDGDRFRIAVVMPETNRDGAQIVAGRLQASVASVLSGEASGRADVEPQVLVIPGDEAALDELRTRFVAIDELDHPAAPRSTARSTAPTPSTGGPSEP